MAVTIGLQQTADVMEGNAATVCAAVLSGSLGGMTFSVTASTANGVGPNAAMGNNC